jgi:diguanylate cyclase (GGDEF)-like protein
MNYILNFLLQISIKFSNKLIFFILLIIQLIVSYFDYITGMFIPFISFYALLIFIAAFTLPLRISVFYKLITVVISSTIFHYIFDQNNLIWIEIYTIISNLIIFTFIALLTRAIRLKIKQLSNEASNDSLTSVLNSKYFYIFGDKELSKAIRQKYMISLIFIDIDNFKKVNDIYGHRAGDILLKGIATTMQKFIRKSDLIGRLGGDEFGILFSNVDHGIKDLILRLKIDLEKQFPGITYSIGAITGIPDELDTIDSLIHNADTQMYVVKNSSKNGIAYIDL